MPVVMVPGTPHADEILKWEFDTFAIGDERGKRGPRVFVEFPKAMYRAHRNDRNQIDLVRGPNGDITIELASDADHQRRLESRGWAAGPDLAIAAQEASEREIAKLAANQAFQTRRMSEKAQAEAAAYEDATPGHVAEIPETPKPRRGRPAKGVSHA